ncbi:hypothetical protein MKW94_027940 [Papaver nudicaule]|uniref:Alpha/beta hydrolase fold-3 domain-containing protein n=1 Tax=Papaver nudicaule TaxID=74823 RepID=A0AA41S6L8_PAPNU|nr:hypothetical protein [Papaver nudicaule]
MDSDSQEVVYEFLPLLRIYKNGRVERLLASATVPSCLQDPETGVSSKDIRISSDPCISARLYIPNNHTHHHKNLPLLVYFHGGGFCLGSAFALYYHRYLNTLVSKANVIAVSVEYRLAPEYPLPIAYEDCWTALQWVLSHSETHQSISNSNHGNSKEPWLNDSADFNKVFLGGDSAGANIAHNIAMRAGENGLKFRGLYLVHPYFWGSESIGAETDMHSEEKAINERLWLFVNPSSVGIDDPMVNPFAPSARSLSSLGCERVLVCVAGKDALRERGRFYCNELKKIGWEEDRINFFESEGEGHAFHLHFPETGNAQLVIERLVSFLRC